MSDIGNEVMEAIMADIPGCVVSCRVQSGSECSAFRVKSRQQLATDQYGASDGVNDTVRVNSALLPGGVTIADAQSFEILENGTTWTKYRVNGLAYNMGMYSFTISDWTQ